MKKLRLSLLATALIALAQPVWSQNVKLATIALKMTEDEVKTALAPNAPLYMHQSSDFPDLYYLMAKSEAESFAFTFIDDKLAAFSVTHILTPGQQSFLPAGQQPTVRILRNLITQQTWAPAEMNGGDTYWFSDASGAPLANATRCAPTSGEAWLPFGSAFSGRVPPEASTAGLMKPSLVTYPSSCGASIHLNETPAETENSVVTSVRYQVLDTKAMNSFLAKHRKH